MNTVYSVLAVASAAAVTCAVRFLPFAVFGGCKRLPAVVKYLGYVLPAAIMASLVIYCLKNVNLTAFPFGLAEIISAAVTAAVHLLRKNTLLSITAGTACYMLLVRTVFPV